MKIKILDSISYEVLLSLSLYKRQTHLKYLSISKDWYESTRKKISNELHTQIEELVDLHFEDLSVHLIEFCPYKSFEGYTSWLSRLSLGEIYEMLSPFLNDKRLMPADLENRRDTHILLLKKWYEEYFKEIEEEVSSALKENIMNINQEELNVNGFNQIEKITKGFSIENLEPTEVVLAPTWHFRPLSLIDIFNHKIILTYPCLLSNNDEALLITKALAEEKRLKILSSMKTEPKTFTDLVKLMGMSKGNIHHHLLNLRSAGLLKIIPSREDYFLYQFRHSRMNDLSSLLLNFD
ncbi:winged helix-turn-helix domain-containing protein [Mesobacillus maritimus]|uniref:winged helix-turn-helix domain-containing protein n=1 Tax=Mesobacillus maritimus TaxID=1643336 RepID=UPI00203E5298|nr:winged helix-turn-helix domain-containing protein [Mesobacillus maritimus]MCM3587754.1 winged helix-turn-helix domain-containing protein [Mesobacillus maritimus]